MQYALQSAKGTSSHKVGQLWGFWGPCTFKVHFLGPAPLLSQKIPVTGLTTVIIWTHLVTTNYYSRPIASECKTHPKSAKRSTFSHKMDKE